MGKKRIFRRHCRASEMGPDKRDGSPTSGFLPPAPLARRSERRKEVATLARIFPKKSENESRNGKRKALCAFSPFPLLSPIYPAAALAHSSRPTCATRGDMQNGYLHPALNCGSHADTRIVHLMARARRVTHEGIQILIVIERNRDHTHTYTHMCRHTYTGWIINLGIAG